MMSCICAGEYAMYVLPAMVHASESWCEKACSDEIQAMQIEMGKYACIACTIISKSGDGSVHKGADPVQKDKALSCGEQKKRISRYADFSHRPKTIANIQVEHLSLRSSVEQND